MKNKLHPDRLDAVPLMFRAVSAVCRAVGQPDPLCYCYETYHVQTDFENSLSSPEHRWLSKRSLAFGSGKVSL